MVKQALKAGLITGLLMSVIAFVMFLWWDSLRTVWPMAFVPLFITGVYAVHRAGRLITDARRATLAGGVAGLAAAVVTVAAVTLLSILLYAELRDLNENLQQKVNEQLQEIERARELKRYLSPQVADSIIAGQSDVKLATTRKNLTVCFADIRGFTGIAERMEPEELIDLLNEYFAAQTEIVFRYGGTLDKYYGDGMMVFFGDPIPYADHAERAVRMALEMKRKLPELEKRWFMRQEERLNIGIGISTGYVTVGNIGSPARLDYTVIGKNVNLASRLADSATPGQILVTERTMVQIQEIVEAREHGERTVEGAARPVRIYEVLGTRLLSA